MQHHLKLLLVELAMIINLGMRMIIRPMQYKRWHADRVPGNTQRSNQDHEKYKTRPALHRCNTGRDISSINER